MSEERKTYEVVQIPRAERDLRKLTPQARGRVLAAILALAEEPRPPGCAKLRGRDGYRIRVGDYRVIYEVDDDDLVVEVLGVGHRRDVYR